MVAKKRKRMSETLERAGKADREGPPPSPHDYDEGKLRTAAGQVLDERMDRMTDYHLDHLEIDKMILYGMGERKHHRRKPI